MILPFVLVTWNDAWGDVATAVTVQEAHVSHKPEVIRTAGWLIVDNEMGVSVVNEHCADGSYRGRSFIPRAMVVSVVPFVPNKPARKPRVKKVKAVEVVE